VRRPFWPTETLVDRDREELESRRILDRVGAETEARMRPRDEQTGAGEDWAEFWGRRIGRVLSFVLFFVAVIWLYQFIAGTG
jgi:hypothetical protein